MCENAYTKERLDVERAYDEELTKVYHMVQLCEMGVMTPATLLAECIDTAQVYQERRQKLMGKGVN